MALTAIVIPLKSQFTKYNGEPIVSFEDDSVYKALQPFLDRMLPGIYIDPYDGASISGHALTQFLDLLEGTKSEINAMPSNWTVQTISWTQGDKQYNRELIAEKEQVLGVISNLINLARIASSKNQMLLFIGD